MAAGGKKVISIVWEAARTGARLRVWIAATALWAAIGGTADGAPFRKGPYLQNVGTQGATIMWETSSPVAARVVVKEPGGKERVIDVPAGRLQEVRVDGLTAGRRYGYTVQVDGESVSGELATAPVAGEPFSFIVFGDNRSGVDAHEVLAERVRREVPDFILGTGDMANEGHSEEDWQMFFDAERHLMKDNVLFPSLGNHDRQGRNSATNYQKYFAVPTESSQTERYYAFTWGSARFLVLDSNLGSFALQDQTSWIERELARAHADARIKHIFVTMHHPPFSVSIHGGHPELREMWTPLFERYRVDAVFSGHDHCYSRAERLGVQYIVSGGGGAPLYPRDPRPAAEDAAATVFFERTYNYVRVQVVGDFVEFAAIRHDGTLIESLSWGAMPKKPPLVASAGAPSAPETVALAATPSTAGTGCGVTPRGDNHPAPLVISAVLVLGVGLTVRRKSQNAHGR